MNEKLLNELADVYADKLHITHEELLAVKNHKWTPEEDEEITRKLMELANKNN